MNGAPVQFDGFSTRFVSPGVYVNELDNNTATLGLSSVAGITGTSPTLAEYAIGGAGAASYNSATSILSASVSSNDTIRPMAEYNSAASIMSN